MSVHCHIAQCLIPKGVCLAEQGRNCRGCKAPTRLCLSCRQLNTIVDAVEGLCKNCSSDIFLHQDQVGLEELEACVTRSLAWMKKVHGLNGSSEIRPPAASPQVKEDVIRLNLQNEDLEYYAKLLLQHALPQEDGALLVLEPVRTLAARIFDPEVKRSSHPSEFSVSQCVSIVNEIAQAYGATIHANGDRSILVIPASYVLERDLNQKPEHSISAPKKALIPPHEEVAQADSLQGRKKPPVVKSKPSDTRIILLLAEEAVCVAEERIVRGAIPLIQTRLLVGARFARDAVERLEREGHILRKQGFACIALTDKPRPPEPEGIEGADHLADSNEREENDLRIREAKRLLSLIPPTQTSELKRIALLSVLLEEKRRIIDSLLLAVQTKTAFIKAHRDAGETIEHFERQTKRVLEECTGAIEQLFRNLS
jgi:hypothetical protein